MADLGWDDFLKQIGGSGGTAVAAPTAAPQPAQETTFDASVIDPDDPAIGLEGPANAINDAAMELMPASAEQLRKTEAATSLSRGGRPVTVSPSKWDSLGQLGARPGIPFDTKTGVPLRVRVAAEKEPTEKEQFASYQIAFGDENVRRNKFGQTIVTTTDEKGRTVDKLANPIGIDATDTAMFIASAPEIAGSILPLIATRGATVGPGVLKALATLVLSTGGAELAGGAKDMYMRWLRGEEPELKEIAGRRAVSGTIGFMTGAGMGTAGFVMGRAISPFNAAGRRQLDAKGAIDFLNSKYGSNLKLTAAEQTGHPLLLAGEALESQKPGSRSAFSQFRQKNQEEMDRLLNIATGVLPDEEQAGKRVVSGLKEKVAPLEFDIEIAAQQAQREAEAAIRAGIGKEVDKVKVGTAVDLGAKARKAGFDLVNDTNYQAFYGNPKATERIIGGDSLKKAVDDLLETLPAVEKEVQVPTGLVDLQNQPVFRTATKTIPVTTPVRGQLEEISAKLTDGKISINDLKQIRTDVDNAIKTGEAVPGVKEGRLKKYYTELTAAIESGLKDINDPQLTKAWATATDYYKKNVGKFETAGIAEIFRDPINAIGPTELVDRALRSPDIYAAYKEFFGVASPQLKGVHQAARDHVLNAGHLGKSLDAGEFVRRLEELDANSPQLLIDAFGKNGEMLRKEAVTMMAAQGQKIPADELRQAMSAGTLSGDQLRDMITAETRRAEAFNNTLVKQLSDGTLKPDKIRPTQVVDRFVFDKNTQPEHLEELIRIASDKPEVLEDLRRLTFKDTLDRATTVESRTGNRTLNGVALDNMLADENLAKRLETVLGEQSYDDLLALRDYTMAGASSQEAFKTAGGLVAGSQINRLLGHGDLKAVPQMIKNFVLATVYTSDWARGYFTNKALSREGKALMVNAFIAADQTREALLRTFTVDKAKEVQATLKGHVDQLAIRDPSSTRQGPAEPTAGTGDIPWDEFLRQIQP